MSLGAVSVSIPTCGQPPNPRRFRHALSLLRGCVDRDLVSQKIVGVDELAQAQREASTADTAAQPVPKVLQPDDPLIQVVPPRREPKM